MVAAAGQSTDNFAVDAGYTYFGQFIDHDVTLNTRAPRVSRSPLLDLDSVYGVGPRPGSPLYGSGPEPLHGARLRIGGGSDDARRGGPAARRRRPRPGRRSPQRRERDHRAAAPAVHPLPQPGRRARRRDRGSRPGSRSSSAPSSWSAGTSSGSWSTTSWRRSWAPTRSRLPSPRAPPWSGHPGVRGGGVPLRPQHGSRGLQAQRGPERPALPPAARRPTRSSARSPVAPPAGRAGDRLAALLPRRRRVAAAQQADRRLAVSTEFDEMPACRASRSHGSTSAKGSTTACRPAPT